MFRMFTNNLQKKNYNSSKTGPILFLDASSYRTHDWLQFDGAQSKIAQLILEILIFENCLKMQGA